MSVVLALQQSDPSDIAAIKQALHFSVAGTKFCLALHYVTRVFPIVQFRYVPGGSSFLSEVDDIPLNEEKVALAIQLVK